LVVLYANFHPLDFAESINPKLLIFIDKLTKPIRRNTSENNSQNKLIKQLYCLMVMLFCTNNQCYMPMHYLLADAVQYHGGSTTLVQILNRVGACASMDTVNRIHTKIAADRIEKGAMFDMAEGTLNIVSIDNIDILQPWTIVSCKNPTRSWHGTSIQCVQPKPSVKLDKVNNFSALNEQNDTDMIECGSLQQRKRLCSSPILSPVTKQYTKRARNLKGNLTHALQIPNSTSFNKSTVVDYRPDMMNKCTTSCFYIQIEEESQLQCIKSTLFKYMLLKHVAESQHENEPNESFPSLIKYVMCQNYDTITTETSKVAYLDILSEISDSKETILKVLDKLHEMFIQAQSNEYVILAADAKLYDILQKLRKEYGNCLQWLIPFPGDWHVLVNYQKTLMKVYWDAGLLQMAQASGHRAETLTSLSLAKKFRRTHVFILESFEAIYRTFFESFFSDICLATKGKLKLTVYELQSEPPLDIERFCSIVREAFDNDLSGVEKQFEEHVNELLESPTCLFWNRFLNYDALAYISLYTSIRCRDWTLRVASIKLMSPIFFAFDRPMYQRLTCVHLADLLCLPKQLTDKLMEGCFTVQITPR
jgi:hypothetical protein